MDKAAISTQPIVDLLAQRWSPRAFNPEREISVAEETALAEAARWAPSCFGAEPWGFVFCRRHADPTAWDKAMACLAEGNQTWAGNSSLLIVAVGEENFEHNGGPNGHHLYDTGAAAMSLVLQAGALGLRAHQMGGFDPDKAKESFGVPDGWKCISMIAVGEQAKPDTLPEGKMREMELAPRTRQDLGKRFFSGKWNTGMTG